MTLVLTGLAIIFLGLYFASGTIAYTIAGAGVAIMLVGVFNMGKRNKNNPPRQ